MQIVKQCYQFLLFYFSVIYVTYNKQSKFLHFLIVHFIFRQPRSEVKGRLDVHAIGDVMRSSFSPHCLCHSDETL